MQLPEMQFLQSWGGGKLQGFLTGDCSGHCSVLLGYFAALPFATAVFFYYYTIKDISYRNHRMTLCRSHHLRGPCSFWVPGLRHSHPGH